MSVATTGGADSGGGGEENGAIRDQRAAKRRRTLGGDAAIAADVDWAAPVSYIHIQLAAGAAPPLRLASRRPRAVVAAAMRAGYALTHVGAVRTATAASTKLAFEPAADAARGAAIDESDLDEVLPFAYSASLAQCLTISVSGGGGGALAAAGLVVESLVAPLELALIASEHARVTVVQSSPTASGGVSLVARDSARIAGIGARFARANIRVRGDAAVDGVRGVQQHIYDGPPPPPAAAPPPAGRRAAARRIVVRSAVFVDSDSDDDDDYSSGSDDYGGGDSSSDEAVNQLYEAHQQQQRGRRQRGAAYVVPERDALLDDAPAADGEDECAICMDRAARARLASCAHSMCVPCANDHRKNGHRDCPFCRARITAVARMAAATAASCSSSSSACSGSSAAAAEASSSNKRKSSEISV